MEHLSIFISMAVAAVAGLAADSFALLAIVGFLVSLNHQLGVAPGLRSAAGGTGAAVTPVPPSRLQGVTVEFLQARERPPVDDKKGAALRWR